MGSRPVSLGIYIKFSAFLNGNSTLDANKACVMRRSLTLPLCLLLLLSPLAIASGDWILYENERFGYSFERPPGLLVVSRLSRGAGVIWQTGTVRVEVSGSNNPYAIKPHEWFENVRTAAGDKIVFERKNPSDSDHYWYEVLYLKNSRRVHRKTYVGSRAVNTIEVSYGYAHRESKQAIGQKIIDSFKPGSLVQDH